ncbi:MAG: hypothetical protein COA74_15340 [Gammaproteobacteria bacterium]|nr:MAG: hypothetical protein COA74_15340 [Gammaproteobacteria bacterium]
MIISGFGPQANTQFPLRTVPTAESGLRGGSETSVTSNNNSVKSTELTTTLFQSVPASPSTNQSTSSKSELSNIEANRRRFELQTESQNASGMTGRALQSFNDVASFEQKDELSSLYGIDIYI